MSLPRVLSRDARTESAMKTLKVEEMSLAWARDCGRRGSTAGAVQREI